MKAIRTDRRIKKIRSVIEARQSSLTVVLENIHDPHNVSAILRTCDAAGIPKVSLLYYIEPEGLVSRGILRSFYGHFNDGFYGRFSTCLQGPP